MKDESKTTERRWGAGWDGRIEGGHEVSQARTVNDCDSRTCSRLYGCSGSLMSLMCSNTSSASKGSRTFSSSSASCLDFWKAEPRVLVRFRCTTGAGLISGAGSSIIVIVSLVATHSLTHSLVHSRRFRAPTQLHTLLSSRRETEVMKARFGKESTALSPTFSSLA